MKAVKIFFISIIILLHQTLLPQQSTWTLILKNNNDRRVTDLLENDSGTIFITEYQRITGTNYYKSSIVKIEKTGLLIDSIEFFKYDTSLLITRILPNSSNDFIVLMQIFNPNNFGNCGFKTKAIDYQLQETISSRLFIFPNKYNTINVNAERGNNNILVFGSIKSGNSSPKMIIYELNQNFDSIQGKMYINEEPMLPMAIHQLSNNNFWIIHGIHSSYVLVDSLLNIISCEYGTIPKWMHGNCGIKWDSDTSFYYVGDFISSIGLKNQNEHDVGFFHQFHPFDTLNNIFNYTGTVDTNEMPAYKNSISYKCKDTIFIGYTKNIDIYNAYYSSKHSFFALTQTDSMLNIRWERFYGGDAYYNMTKLIATNDGGCIMAGTRFDYKAHPNLKKRDIYIIKVNSEGLFTSADGKHAGMAHDAIVYPNPGSDRLRVTVAFQHKRSVFRLYDMSGKLVAEKRISGRNAEIDTRFLIKGTYVYTITNNKGLNEKGKWVKR